MRAALPSLAIVCLAGAFALLGCAGPRAELVLSTGVEAHRAGDHVAAALKYREALRLDPEVRGAWQNLSILALVANRPSDAVDLAREEMRIHADSPEAALHLALVQLRADQTEAALATLRPLLQPRQPGQGAPPSPAGAAARALVADQARLLLALGLWRLGRVEDAELPLKPLLTPVRGGTFAAERAVLASDARIVGSWLALQRGEWAAVLAEPAAHPIARSWARYRSGEEATAAPPPPDPAGAEEAIGGAQRAWLALVSAVTDPQAPAALASALGPESPHPVRVAAWRLRAARRAGAGDWQGALGDLEAAAADAPTPEAALWLDRAVALAHLGREDEARLAVAGVLRDAPQDTRARALRALLGP